MLARACASKLALFFGEKMHQLCNVIAWDYNYQFWWHLAAIFRRLWNSLHVSVFIWVCFLLTLRLSS